MLAGASSGDFDCDGRVTFEDFLILSDNYGSEGAHVTPELGDADGDMRVNFTDFLVLSANFGQTLNAIFDVELAPSSPASLVHEESVDITFSYTKNVTEGVHIWARPMSGGSLAPDYSAHGSPVYVASSGTGSGHFTITTGDVHVDQVRLQMWNDTQTDLLFEKFIDVDYTFGEVSPRFAYAVDANMDGLYTINIDTGEVADIGPLFPDPDRFTTPVSMAINPRTQEIFVINNSPIRDAGLSRVDPATGLATFVGPTQVSDAIAFANGILFGQGVGNRLVTVNTTTGATTDLDGDSVPVLYGLDYNTTDGFLYGITGDVNGQSELLRISTAGELLATLPLSDNIGSVPGSVAYVDAGRLIVSNLADQLFDVDPTNGVVSNQRPVERAPQGMGLIRRAQPDLVPVPDPRPGFRFCRLGSVGLIVEVQNVGLAAANSSVVRVGFDTFNAGTVFQTASIPSLVPGASATVEIPIPLGSYNPDAHFQIEVDYTDLVSELDELNNEGSGFCLG